MGTAAPTTMAPTAAPTTNARTAAPTTKAPTAAPTTTAPTAAPTTTAPTAAPTTKAPTAAPTTKAPSAAPTFLAPTAAPTNEGTTPEHTLEKISDDGRCRGSPHGGWGAGELGKDITLQECKQRCLESVTCTFVVYKRDSKKCWEYTKCAKRKGKFVKKGRTLETWQKVASATPSPTPSTRRLLIV